MGENGHTEGSGVRWRSFVAAQHGSVRESRRRCEIADQSLLRVQAAERLQKLRMVGRLLKGLCCSLAPRTFGAVGLRLAAGAGSSDLVRARMPNIFGLFNHRKPWDVSFPRKATEADVVYCFRLLLGRKPGEQEWGGHAWKIGEDLGSVVTSYLNSQEFAKRRSVGAAARSTGSWSSCRPSRCTLRPRTSRSASIDHRQTRVRAASHRSFSKSICGPGWRVLDIGANIGYFSLLAASLVGPRVLSRAGSLLPATCVRSVPAAP